MPRKSLPPPREASPQRQADLTAGLQAAYLARCQLRRVEAVEEVLLRNRHHRDAFKAPTPVYGLRATLAPCGHRVTYAPGTLGILVGEYARCVACGPAR